MLRTLGVVWIAARAGRRVRTVPQVALEYVGGIAELGAKALITLFKRSVSIFEILTQIEVIGVNSLVIVLLTAIFSSLVMTLQFGVQLQRFGALLYVGNVISLSLIRELGPVLTALMVGGRVGAGITAELGSMAVTEQIDAMRSMGADPIQKLVLPRVIATVFTLPLLTTLAIVLGIVGASVLARFEYHIGFSYFFNSLTQTVTLSDYVGGITKTVFFGLFMSMIACYEGLSTRGGTEGVGRSTTHTVVISSIMTLISDFVLTSVLLSMGF